MAFDPDGRVLARVRALALSLPETSERLSHGAPAFFVRTKQFAMFLDDHHADGRLALWCAAPEGSQDVLVRAEPEHYFVPPYVGWRGWIGVRLDRGLPDEELAGALEDAWAAVAPKKLLEATLAERPQPDG